MKSVAASGLRGTLDAAALAAAAAFAPLACGEDIYHRPLILASLIFALGFGLILSAAAGRELRRNAELPALARMGGGLALGILLAFGLLVAQHESIPVAMRFAIASGLIAFALLVLLRLGYAHAYTRHTGSDVSRALIVGAGDAAVAVVHTLREHPRLRYHVVGCVDDEVAFKRVGGVRLLGRVADIPALIERHDVDSVIIAIPSAALSFVNEVTAACSQARNARGTGPSVKVIPGISDLLSDRVTISRLRDIRLEDLLHREPVKKDLNALAPHLEDQVVLVTGAGGSIGSELCRQIVGFNPKLLLLLGHGENSLFTIDQELRQQKGFTRTKIVLADVADSTHIRRIFSTYRPSVVFHAAAHKHVPILETNVCEAVRNNVFGTHVVALAAAAAGVAKFVMLSTDKAVNPTSVMGATKRLAELTCQSFAHKTGTEFVAVRFGNVLGSRGSVLPIFKRQLEEGGPITITHRDMQRYFMTIPEAVSLVLEAMAIGRDGQVFVLDMGEPVRILTLAETVIRLSGLVPYRDIDIVETGIRPGEKLFEEILTSHEGMSRTSHERLFIAEQERIPYETLALAVMQLETAVRISDWKSVVGSLQELVPTFTPGAHLREPAVESQEAAEAAGSAVPQAAALLESTATNGRGSTEIIETIRSDREDVPAEHAADVHRPHASLGKS